MKAILIASLLMTAPVMADSKESLLETSARLIKEASTLEASKKYADAQFALERALVADPTNPQIMVMLGHIHEQQGRIGKGLKYYRHALDLDPTLKPAMESQALAFLKKNMLVKAEIVMDKLAVYCKDNCSEMTTVKNAIASYKKKKEEDLLASNKKGDEAEAKNKQ